MKDMLSKAIKGYSTVHSSDCVFAMASMAYSRGTGVTCEGALTGNDGMGWVGIHRGVMSFSCFICGVSGMVQSFMIWRLSFSFDDDYVFWLWYRHKQWFFAANVMILISQFNTCF